MQSASDAHVAPCCIAHEPVGLDAAVGHTSAARRSVVLPAQVSNPVSIPVCERMGWHPGSDPPLPAVPVLVVELVPVVPAPLPVVPLLVVPAPVPVVPAPVPVVPVVPAPPVVPDVPALPPHAASTAPHERAAQNEFRMGSSSRSMGCAPRARVKRRRERSVAERGGRVRFMR